MNAASRAKPGPPATTDTVADGQDEFDWVCWAREIADRARGDKRSVGAAEALGNAEEAVRLDPVRLELESAEREAARRRWRAVMLSPTLEVCEAMLRGEAVPLEALDESWRQRFGRRTA